MHLRMTGTLLLDPAPATAATRACASRSTTAHELRFCDPRRFGTGELALGDAALRRVLRRPPGRRAARRRASRPSACARWPAAAARRSRRSCSTSARIAGVGNIYADEALFRARIHPLRPAGALTRAQLRGAARRGRRRRWRPASTRAARRSTTSATPTACAAPSRTSSSSTCARASRARVRRRRSSRCVAGGPRDVRLRALPAAAAGAASGGVSSRSRPARSAVHASPWKPPSELAVDERPAGSSSSRCAREQLGRPSGSFARLTPRTRARGVAQQLPSRACRTSRDRWCRR